MKQYKTGATLEIISLPDHPSFVCSFIMQNAIVQFCDIPDTKVTIDKEMAARGVAERISMPWFVVRQYKTTWSNKIPIYLTLENREEALQATIVNPVPIVSTCPLVLYSCKVFVDETDQDDIKVTVGSHMVPEGFQPCPCKSTSKKFELCSCLVRHLFLMAGDPNVHNQEDLSIAMGVKRTLTHALENIKMPDNRYPFSSWLERAFLFPYNMLYRIPMMIQGCNTKQPSKLLSAYFDFTLFCQNYEQVDLYFSLCCYMHPARVHLFMKNTKVAHSLLKNIRAEPLRAFLGQLIEVEGLRQAAQDVVSGDVKKLYAITDAELQSAVRVHEDLLCEALMRGTSDVQLYSDFDELKLLAWMGGILVNEGKTLGRLTRASLAGPDCVARLQHVASYWHPQGLLPANSLDQHLQNTNLLFVNNRGTCGRSSPLIKKELDYYRRTSLITLVPSDVTALEERFDQLCRSLERLYSPNNRFPVIPVVTIVDLHLFSPLMLRTILTFLLECQHGFKYNDIVSPKTYRNTRTSLPFKLLFFGDFVAHSFRGGTNIANEFLDLGENRACFYRDNLNDALINDDPYAKHVQMGMFLDKNELCEIAVEQEDEKEPSILFRVHVEGWKTRIYRCSLPLPDQPIDENEYIGKEMGPTLIQLPFSSVHLATTDPKHIYTALTMTAGDVFLHVPKSEMAHLALD